MGVGFPELPGHGSGNPEIPHPILSRASLQGCCMITDARVLDPTFVPADVKHRDAEIDALTAALDPILRGEYADPVILHGPAGTGKTCIARYTADRLRDEVPDLDTPYVNCWEDHTRFKTLYRILEDTGQSLTIHRQSTPTDDLLDRLRDADARFVVVLDELDQHEDTGVLYDLYRVRGLSMVLIANRERELFARFDERVASRLRTATSIHFDRYGVTELVGILEDRARWGLAENAVATDQLERIADAAAGDARTALGILRSAARKAVERGHDRITDELVDAAEPAAKAEIQRKNIEKLNPDQQMLYDIIRDNENGIAPRDLYAAYADRVEDPKTERTLRNYLQKMCHYNLIAADGDGRSRTYRSL